MRCRRSSGDSVYPCSLHDTLWQCNAKISLFKPSRLRPVASILADAQNKVQQLLQVTREACLKKKKSHMQVIWKEEQCDQRDAPPTLKNNCLQDLKQNFRISKRLISGFSSHWWVKFNFSAFKKGLGDRYMQEKSVYEENGLGLGEKYMVFILDLPIFALSLSSPCNSQDAQVAFHFPTPPQCLEPMG